MKLYIIVNISQRKQDEKKQKYLFQRHWSDEETIKWRQLWFTTGLFQGDLGGLVSSMTSR